MSVGGCVRGSSAERRLGVLALWQPVVEGVPGVQRKCRQAAARWADGELRAG